MSNKNKIHSFIGVINGKLTIINAPDLLHALEGIGKVFGNDTPIEVIEPEKLGKNIIIPFEIPEKPDEYILTNYPTTIIPKGEA